MTRPFFHTAATRPTTTIQYATSPRHLAGGGDPRRVTEVLRAAGWTVHSEALYPHVLLASPDTSVRLVLEPSIPDTYQPWWRIDAGSWYAHFGGHTPVESIAGFTDALLHPAPDNAPSREDIRDLLESAGWGRQRSDTGVETVQSPDRTVAMGPISGPVSAHSRPTWYAEAVLTGGRPQRLWQSWFSHHTPAHLIHGFAQALASSDPVYRGSTGLPCSWLLTQKPAPVQGEQLDEEHRQLLATTRAAARRQRRAAAAKTPSPHPTAASPRPKITRR